MFLVKETNRLSSHKVRTFLCSLTLSTLLECWSTFRRRQGIVREKIIIEVAVLVLIIRCFLVNLLWRLQDRLMKLKCWGCHWTGKVIAGLPRQFRQYLPDGENPLFLWLARRDSFRYSLRRFVWSQETWGAAGRPFQAFHFKMFCEEYSFRESVDFKQLKTEPEGVIRALEGQNVNISRAPPVSSGLVQAQNARAYSGC